MGSGMASSLMRAGYAVAGFDLGSDAMARFESAGGEAAPCRGGGPRQRHRRLRGPQCGPDAGRPGPAPRGSPKQCRRLRAFISSATMEPDRARAFAARLEARRRHDLDAPISGGAARAAEGALTILALGSPAAFRAARPALDAMAAKLYELGNEAGLGAAFKMVNQHLAGIHIAAAGEAIAFAARQGLDLERVYEVITASAGNSWMFENCVPHVLQADYAPRSAIEIFVEDSEILQDMARSTRFPVPVAAAALQMFLASSASARRDDDASVAEALCRA